MYDEADAPESFIDFKEQLISELRRKDISVTSQAITSLTETLRVSSSEIVGDTDTLLAGLLLSGSYAVDILETAGVNPVALRKETLDSVSPWVPESDYSIQSFESLLFKSDAFNRAVDRSIHDGRILETSHILEAAINPVSEYEPEIFPIEDRSDPPPKSQLLIELEKGVCLILEHLTDLLTGYKRKARHTLKIRRHPITKKEDERLNRILGPDYRDMKTDELEFAIAALNQWFVHRRILTDPSNLCLRVVNRLESNLLFGPNLFVNADGDIKAVQIGLQNAKKYSPERDLPSVALFMRDGRIQVGQYTYRNAFAVETGVSTGFPLSRVHLQAVRPVPIISQFVLTQFEELISRENLKEGEIQQFLNKFPEFLQSLGYSSARPHICLRSEDYDRLIPDFILELPGGKGFDILDLKLPTGRLTARVPYLRVSSELMKAVAQLRQYGKYFQQAVYRKAFEKKYGLLAFRPELVVVMGRDNQFDSRDDRLEIESQLNNVRLITYDELIAYGKSRSLILPRNLL